MNTKLNINAIEPGSIPLTVFDDDAIQNMPFEKGDADNSAVLKGGNNIAGLKGWYYEHIYITPNNPIKIDGVSYDAANIYLTDVQTKPTLSESAKGGKSNIINNEFVSGDIISIVNDDKYDRHAVFYGYLKDNKGIRVYFPKGLPFTSIKSEPESEWSPEDYSIYCLDKPLVGIVDIGQYAIATGSDNKAINVYTEVHGKDNVAEGKFATVWGKENFGGYCTTTFGEKNTNKGYRSLVSGTLNENIGGNSTVFGNKNINYGKRAFVTGNENINVSENGSSFGSNNIVGLKGWYYKAIQFNTTSGVTFLYLSKTQQVPEIVTQASDVEQERDIDFGLIVNDVVSVINDSKYDNKYKISTNEISTYGRIGLKSVASDIPFPFDKVNTDDDLNNGIFDPEDYSIYCVQKPNIGITDIGQDSFVAGYNNKATNGKATAFGYDNHAYGKFSFVEGRGNEAGYAAHAEGRDCIAKGEMSHAGGLTTHANGKASFSHGQDTRANGHSSFAMGYGAKANGEQSISLGYNTSAEGAQSVALGNNTQAIGNVSHAENAYTVAEGRASHAEGFKSKVSLSEGNLTDNYERSAGYAAHAEGHTTQSIGCGAHSEGGFTTALGNFTHAEGYRTHAKGSLSHAEGKYTKTTNEAEHASGKYNVSNPDTQFSIGIGTSDTARKNAFEVKQNGDIYIEGVEGRIQDKLNNTNIISGADWNAQEGEAGYIENKPFDFKFNEDENLSNNWVNGILDINGEYLTSGDLIVKVCTNSEYVDDTTEPIWDMLVLQAKFVEGKQTFLLEKHNIRFAYIDGAWNISIIDSEFVDAIPIYISDRTQDLKQLSEAFIPYTVVKTTPQQLSDTEKNQALANLGIKEEINAKFGLSKFIGYLTLNDSVTTNYKTSNDNYHYGILNEKLITIEDDNGMIDVAYGPPFKINRVVNYPKITFSIVSDVPNAHQLVKIPIYENMFMGNIPNIDPVVWKYMCSPYNIYIDSESPYEACIDSELVGEKNDHDDLGEVYNFKYLIPLMYRYDYMQNVCVVNTCGYTKNSDDRTLSTYLNDEAVHFFIKKSDDSNTGYYLVMFTPV